MLSFKGLRYNNGRVADDSEVEMVQDMYDAITKANAWDFVKQDPGSGGFMFCTDPIMQDIEKNMKTLDTHSGASFASLMRMMQLIARIGEEAAVQAYGIRIV